MRFANKKVLRSISRNVVMPVHFMDMITTLFSQLSKKKVKGYIIYLMLDVFFKVFDNSCQNSHRGGNSSSWR